VGLGDGYLTALGVLTRLGPARSDPDMTACPAWFGAVGAPLGFVLTVPLAWACWPVVPAAAFL
jgi:hypothetical protein